MNIKPACDFYVHCDVASEVGRIDGQRGRSGPSVRKAKPPMARTGEGAVTVFDRKRGLVVSDAA